MHSHYIEPALFRVFENLFGLHKEQFKILISPLIHKVQNFQSKVNLDIKERKTKCVTRFIHKYSFIQHITIFLSFIHLNLFTFSNLIHWYHTHPTNIQHYIQQIFVFSFITFLSLLSLFLSFVQFRRVPFVFFFRVSYVHTYDTAYKKNKNNNIKPVRFSTHNRTHKNSILLTTSYGYIVYSVSTKIILKSNPSERYMLMLTHHSL